MKEKSVSGGGGKSKEKVVGGTKTIQPSCAKNTSFTDRIQDTGIQ